MTTMTIQMRRKPPGGDGSGQSVEGADTETEDERIQRSDRREKLLRIVMLIEKTSLFLFPALFLIFNCIYWYWLISSVSISVGVGQPRT
jgi:hypothetical protein